MWKVEYSILSTDPVSTARRRVFSVISDLRQLGSESCEAALRKLLASRATGGYAMTSEDPTALTSDDPAPDR